MRSSTIARCCFFLLIMTSASSGQRQVVDSCAKHVSGSPRYYVGFSRSWTHADESITEMNVSVTPSDITQDRLISLVCKITAAHRKADVLIIWILDSRKAAKRFRFTGQGISGSGFKVRGSYSYNRKASAQQLTWTPDPENPSSSIKIVLKPLVSEKGIGLKSPKPTARVWAEAYPLHEPLHGTPPL